MTDRFASGDILLERAGSCWTVTLNRPDHSNAITGDMLAALKVLCERAKQDTALRVLRMTGSGERSFCGGADLSEARTRDNPRHPLWNSVSQLLRELPVLTIAMLNGHCIGGGLILALCCDLRVAVPEAQFAYPALRMGALPGAVDHQRLQTLIGPGRTAQLLLADERIDAKRALDWGLIERLEPRDSLITACDTLGGAANGASRQSLFDLKRVLTQESHS